METTYSYDGEGEIGLGVLIFNQTSPKYTLRALDATYQVDPQSLEYIPNQ
jgi:hypothetical protein